MRRLRGVAEQMIPFCNKSYHSLSGSSSDATRLSVLWNYRVGRRLRGNFCKQEEKKLNKT